MGGPGGWGGWGRVLVEVEKRRVGWIHQHVGRHQFCNCPDLLSTGVLGEVVKNQDYSPFEMLFTKA